MKLQRRRAVRCVSCRSLKTVKNGKRQITVVSFSRGAKGTVQRYQCVECGRYFSKRRERGKKYSLGFKVELARMHVEERMSYRVMAKRIAERFGKKVSPRLLCRMVNEVAARAKGSIAMQREFRPRWEGYLTVDDKNINIRGRKVCSLVAVDSSGDPIHAELMVEVTQDGYDEFFRFIMDRLGYPIKAVTSDLDGMLAKAVKTVISSDIPHQRCLWHAGENIKKMINYQQTQSTYWRLVRRTRRLCDDLGDHKPIYETSGLRQLENELKQVEAEYRGKEGLLRAIAQTVYQRKRTETFRQFSVLRRRYGRRYPEVIAWLRANLEALLMHQQDDKIPRTNNLAENLNKQLTRRFKTIEAFQTIDTAWNYLNLIRSYLRFKPYTDCRGRRRYRNGKSPLELCGVKLRTRNWLRHAINYT